MKKLGVVGLLCVLWAAGCDETGGLPGDMAADSGSSGDAGASVAVVGPAGGSFLFHGGKVRLEVPPGALAKETTIRALKVASYPSASEVVPGTVYDLLPDGTTFSKAARLSIFYDDADALQPESALRIHKLVDGAWVARPEGGVDTAADYAWATIDGFSNYGVKGASSSDGGAGDGAQDAAPPDASTDLTGPCSGRPAGSPCDDGNPCTSADSCDGKGACAGAAYSCTSDQCQSSSVCDGKGGCTISFKIKGSACDDTLACTKADVCDGKGTCAGILYTCSGGSCATSTCDGKGGCKTTHKASGSACDDKEPCTSADACDGKGKCAGKAYTCKPGQCTSVCDGKGGCSAGFKAKNAACDDQRACTLNDACDGAGTCMGTSIKNDHCLIVGLCIKDGVKHPTIKCHQCNVKKSQTIWSPNINTCVIAGKCYNQGDQHPGGCALCDPASSQNSWTAKSGHCLISGTCYKSGTKSSSCTHCLPVHDKYGWTGGCTIAGQCHPRGAKKYSGGCVCDPAKSLSAWTATSTDCVVDGACFAHGGKEVGGCGVCKASSAKAAFTKPKGCAVTLEWSRAFLGSGKYPSNYGNGLGTDSKGNVYLTGGFTDSITIGSVPHKAGSKRNIYLASFTPTGVYRWSISFGNSATFDEAGPLAVDTADNVYITGESGGNVYLASYTAAGKPRWSKSFGTVSYNRGHGVDTDAAGNVYLTGTFNKTIDLGGGTLTTSKGYTVFLASFTSAGKHRWSRTLTTSPSSLSVRGLVADKAGNSYIAGGFGYYPTDLGGGTLPNKGGTDIFVASYNSSGKHRWSSALGSTKSQTANGVAQDPAGNVYIIGLWKTEVPSCYPAFCSWGKDEVVVASYSSAGKFRWSRIFGSTNAWNNQGYDNGNGIAADKNGNVYVTGWTSGKLRVNGKYYAYVAESDLFMVSLSSNGGYRWVRTHGGGDSDSGQNMAVDPSGRVLVTGAFRSKMSFGGATHTGLKYGSTFLLKLK